MKDAMKVNTKAKHVQGYLNFPGQRITVNRGTKVPAITIFVISLILIPILCVAAGGREDEIQLYDGEMLLQDLKEKTRTGEPQKPLVHMDDTQSQTAIEVPRSIKYNTSLIDEGARFFRAGRYREAASALEMALELYRKDGFAEGEIAVLGNLYLTYTELGEKEKALQYLEACRKKRRQK
jgi:tetratricopeptide (TPR) repeat protein